MKGTIRCPTCKKTQPFTQAENICVEGFTCIHCNTFNTLEKNCCVFCVYGVKPCSLHAQKRK